MPVDVVVDVDLIGVNFNGLYELAAVVRYRLLAHVVPIAVLQTAKHQSRQDRQSAEPQKRFMDPVNYCQLA